MKAFLSIAVCAVLLGSFAIAPAVPLEEATSTLPSEFQPAILVQFAVSDLERSIVFYRDVVGLEFELRIDDLRWARFKTAIPGVILGLGESSVVSGSGTTSLNLSVDDVEASRQRLEKAGVEFLGPTKHIPGVVRLADFLDPDGNKIRLAGHGDTD